MEFPTKASSEMIAAPAPSRMASAAGVNAVRDMTGHGLPLEQTRNETTIFASRGDDDSAQVLPRNNDLRKQGSSPAAKLSE